METLGSKLKGKCKSVQKMLKALKPVLNLILFISPVTFATEKMAPCFGTHFRVVYHSTHVSSADESLLLEPKIGFLSKLC